jgi:hypothetical protein
MLCGVTTKEGSQCANTPVESARFEDKGRRYSGARCALHKKLGSNVPWYRRLVIVKDQRAKK